MRSRVKFIYRSTDEKIAYIEPASNFLKDKLERHKGCHELMIRAEEGHLGMTVLENLLFIEVLAYESLDDDRIYLVQSEIVKLREMKLLSKVYSDLSNSEEPEDKKTYRRLSTLLRAKKLEEVALKQAKKLSEGNDDKTIWDKFKESFSKLLE